MSDAWKRHERKVAEYFKTKRRVRGDDFSQSDVEILASVENWLGWENSNAWIIGECKYAQRLGIVSLFKKAYHNDFCYNNGKVTILRIEDGFFCKLEDFEEVYVKLIDNQTSCENIISMSESFNIVSKDGHKPKYVSDYLEQSRNYKSKLSKTTNPFPIAIMAKGSVIGKVVGFEIRDIELFWEKRQKLL